MRILQLLIFILVLLFFSCSKDNNPISPEEFYKNNEYKAVIQYGNPTLLKIIAPKTDFNRSISYWQTSASSPLQPYYLGETYRAVFNKEFIISIAYRHLQLPLFIIIDSPDKKDKQRIEESLLNLKNGVSVQKLEDADVIKIILPT
jgi:hypothetical protein